MMTRIHWQVCSLSLSPCPRRIVTVRNLRLSEVALRVRFLAHLQLAPQRPLPFDRHGAYYKALPVAVARDLSDLRQQGP